MSISSTTNKKGLQISLREKCPNAEFFLVRIFLYSDYPYSVRIQENTDQKNTQCLWQAHSSRCKIKFTPNLNLIKVYFQHINNHKPLLKFNPFHATNLFLYLLKTSENQSFFYVFRGYRETPMG